MKSLNFKGFTLVELVIVIIIVGILSIVAVPIYKGYVERAKMTEGKALAGALKTAELVYYAEKGSFYLFLESQYNDVLNMDARGNKYFQNMKVRTEGTDAFVAWAIPLAYNAENDIAVGIVFTEPGKTAIFGGLETPVYIKYTNSKGLYEYFKN